MKHSEAVEAVHKMCHAIHLLRADAEAATDGAVTDKSLWVSSEPWVFDDNISLVHRLEEAVQRLDAGEVMEPIPFYNVLFLVDRYSLLTKIACRVIGYEVPEPDFMICRGWEPEDDAVSEVQG